MHGAGDVAGPRAATAAYDPRDSRRVPVPGSRTGHEMQSPTATPATSRSGEPPGRRHAARSGQWRLATRFTVAVVALAIPLELIVLLSGLSSLQERRAAEL